MLYEKFRAPLGNLVEQVEVMRFYVNIAGGSELGIIFDGYRL
jgi:hypothetical protein